MAGNTYSLLFTGTERLTIATTSQWYTNERTMENNLVAV
jgi:hypothetical protein